MSKFLRDVFASMAGVFAAGALLLFAFLASLPEAEAIAIHDDSILVVDLTLPIVDDPKPAGLSALLGYSSDVNPYPLHAIAQSIRLAADDPRIVGLYLTGGVAGTGWASLHEIRSALIDFSASEKPITTYFPYYNERSLYLASVGDRTYAPPFSDVDLGGPAAEINYYADAFQRFGVEVQVTRVGKFKSAVEPYMLGKMSDENREQIRTLLDDIFQPCLQQIAEGFEIDYAKLQSIVAERGVMTSAEGVEVGLIDNIRYEEEVASELREITGEGQWDGAGRYDYEQVWLDDYIAAEYEEDSRVDGATIAVLFAEGEIIDGGSDDQVGGESLAAQLEAARVDEGIAAVVLRVNSPGGSASASEVILHQVELLAAEKPLIISMGDVAASGGYWISTLADEIYAEANTITGSIGVFGMFPNVAGLAQEMGVAVETVELSPYGDPYSLYRSKSEAMLARLQVSVDEVYDGFLDRVARGREMEVPAVHEIAQGRVWSGSRALELGLIDKVGGLGDALERAANLAGLNDGYATEYWSYEVSAFEEFLNQLAQETPNDLVQLQALVESVQRLAPRNGVQVRLPYQLTLR